MENLLIQIYARNLVEIQTIIEKTDLNLDQVTPHRSINGTERVGPPLFHALYAGNATVVRYLLDLRRSDGSRRVDVNCEVNRITALDLVDHLRRTATDRGETDNAANYTAIQALLQNEGAHTFNELSQNTHSSCTSRTVRLSLERLQARYGQIDVPANCQWIYQQFADQERALRANRGETFVARVNKTLDFIKHHASAMAYANNMTHQDALAYVAAGIVDTKTRVVGSGHDSDDAIRANRLIALWDALASVANLCPPAKFNAPVSALTDLHPDTYVIADETEIGGSIQRAFQGLLSDAFRRQSFTHQLAILATPPTTIGERFYRQQQPILTAYLQTIHADLLPEDKYPAALAQSQEIDFIYPDHQLVTYLTTLVGRLQATDFPQGKLFSPQPGCTNFSSYLPHKQKEFIAYCRQHITTTLAQEKPFIDLWNTLPPLIQTTVLTSLINKQVYFILPGARLDIHKLLPAVLANLSNRTRVKTCEDPDLVDYLKTEILDGKMFLHYLRAMPLQARFNFVTQAYNSDLPWSVADILTLMKLAPWEDHRPRFLAALQKEIKTVSDLIDVHEALAAEGWSTLLKEVPLADIVLTTGQLTVLLKHCGKTHFSEAMASLGNARIDAIFFDWVQLVEVMEQLDLPLRVKLLAHLSPERLRLLTRECELLGVLFQLLPEESHHLLLDKLGDDHLREVTRENSALAQLTPEIAIDQRAVLFYKLGTERIHNFIQNGQHLSEALAILPPEHRESLLHLLGKERLGLIIQRGRELRLVLAQFAPEKRGPLCLVWGHAFVETGSCVGVVLQQVPQAQWPDLRATITDTHLQTVLYDKTQLRPLFTSFSTREDLGAVLKFLGLSVIENAIEQGGDFYEALGWERFPLAIAHIPADKLCRWFSDKAMEKAAYWRVHVPAEALALVDDETIFYKLINYLVAKSQEAGNKSRYNERIIDFATILNFIEDHLESANLQTDLASLLPTLKRPSTRSTSFLGLVKSQEIYQKLRSELSTINVDSLRNRFVKLKSIMDQPLPEGSPQNMEPRRKVIMELDACCRNLRLASQSAAPPVALPSLRKSRTAVEVVC